jgi:hypothetical protein
MKNEYNQIIIVISDEKAENESSNGEGVIEIRRHSNNK